MNIELSEQQQSTVATAVTILAATVILLAIATLFWLIGTFLNRFSSIFLPIAVAAVAALVVNPYYDGIRKRLRAGKVLALVLVFLSAIIPLVAVCWIFGAIIFDQIRGIIQSFPQWWQAVMTWVTTNAPQLELFLKDSPFAETLSGAVEGQSDALLGSLQAMGGRAISAGAGFVSGVLSLLCWVVFPVYFSFFLMTETAQITSLENYLVFLKADTRKDVVYLLQEFLNIIVAFFRGQLIIAFLQGLLFAIGFTVVGLKYGFVIGLTLGFLNIVPYLGNIIGLATALPIGFFQSDGGIVRVLLVLVVFVLVQMIEGYFLTPKIMGDRTGLHPVVIIIAVFFWGAALNGILGMILAIPLTAFLVVFWRLAKEKYLRELV